MSWHKVTLSAKQVAGGDQVKIQNAFEQLFLKSMAPEGMALFGGGFDENRTMSLYFSPASLDLASPLILIYHGVPCEKPNREGLSLLVGHAGAFSLLN
jgi:hypothetical protein